VNSKKVKNKTLKAKDFADGQLEQGVQGIQGLQGEKGEKGDPGEDGAAGATNVVVRRANVPLAASGFTQAGIGCEAGELATGGGFSTGLDAAYAMRSTPSDDGGNNAAQDGEVPNGWVIRFHNTSATTSTGTISVICASP
jgi:hypothetical protein